MNLIVDIGNTRTKFYIFNRGDLAISVPVDDFEPGYIELLQNEYPQLDKAIVSSVKDYSPEIKQKFQESFQTFVELDSETPLPVQNNYKTKETLGYDRIAAVVGANCLYPGENILVIDAGSAITYDFISDKGVYLGGNISPGMEMRYKALNKFTGKLPLVGLKKSNVLFGDTTESAIRAGVQNGIIYEVDATIGSFKDFYNNLKVIITGGDANFFDKKLKNSFFVNFNLTGIGLNRILEYNGETEKS